MVTPEWFARATARHAALSKSLSAYIRELVSGDCDAAGVTYEPPAVVPPSADAENTPSAESVPVPEQVVS